MSTVTPRAFKHGARVMWRDGFKPVKFPCAADAGTVFTSSGRLTYVLFDGETSPRPIATAALERAS